MKITWTGVMQIARLQNPPQYGRRKMRQLEGALATERAKNELLTLRMTKARDDYDRLEGVVRDLLVHEVHYQDKIADLENRLEIAINSAWSNEQLTSFAFFDRPQDHPLDQATSPIDVSMLRAEWDEEPLEGKVTQFNPSTGRHDTVELDRDEILSEGHCTGVSAGPLEIVLDGAYGVRKAAKTVEITLLPSGVGSASPVHIPGLVQVS